MPSSTEYPDNPPDDLAGWCRYFGLPDDAHINGLMRHVMNNAAATIGVKDLIIKLLEDRPNPLDASAFETHLEDGRTRVYKGHPAYCQQTERHKPHDFRYLYEDPRGDRVLGEYYCRGEGIVYPERPRGGQLIEQKEAD